MTNLNLPFNQGSSTSQTAAESQDKEQIHAAAERIFKLIEKAGATGYTDKELEKVMGMRHESVSARRRGLVLAGRIVDSGKERPTPTGRPAKVWIVGQGAIVEGKKLTKVGRPSNKVLHAAAAEINLLVHIAEAQGTDFQNGAHHMSKDDLIHICQWLNSISNVV